MISGRTYGLKNKQLHVWRYMYGGTCIYQSTNPTNKRTKDNNKKVRDTHVRLGWCITSDILLYKASDTINHPIARARNNTLNLLT